MASTDPGLVLKEKGWDTGVWLLGPPSDSVVRPAAYIVSRGLHKDGSVNMAPIDFMSDLSTDWYGTISGDKREVPLLVMDGVVYGESLPMVLSLMERFPEPDSSPEAQKQLRAFIDMAIASKSSSDALLKHFGFCAVAAGAKEYRYKGSQEGEGLKWIQAFQTPL